MAKSPLKMPKSRVALGQVDLSKHAVQLVVRAPARAGGRVRAPYIAIDPPIVLPGMRTGISRAAVFTATTKMRCPSFSLPAGPPKQGGTCPASALKPAERLDDEWICAGCYATGGNYMYPSTQVTQGIRKLWVERALANGTFADELAWALAQLLAAPRFGTAQDGAKPELDRRYFRIHDSGDFSWGKEPYILAWFDIVRRFPKVTFWAPTRDWTGRLGEKYNPLFAQAPKNLVIRPSALFKNNPPPVVPGLAAGSSVAVAGRDVRFLTDQSGREVFNCPAYAQDEHSCESGKNPMGKVGCRACWIRPELQINYAPHGGITATGDLVQLRVRKNPDDALERLYAAFRREHGKGRGESGRLFAAYLARQGLRPTSFPEAVWLRLLRAEGVTDPDEQAERLESLLEW